MAGSRCGGPDRDSGWLLAREERPIAAQVSLKSETTTASGISDATTGTYTLMSGPSDSIPVGTYQIAVSDPPADEAVDTASADYAAMMEGGAANVVNESEIPEKYSRFGSSGLEFTVTEGANSFDIELE